MITSWSRSRPVGDIKIRMIKCDPGKKCGKPRTSKVNKRIGVRKI